MHERGAMRPAELIRDTLSERIITGLVANGSRLDEQRLAEEFGVSRTPLREALQMLQGSGLVRHELRRGTFVQFPSLDEVLEMFQVMAEVEAICGRYAARRMTQTLLQEIGEALAECRMVAEGGDLEGYYLANHRFHSLIYAASGNRFLTAEAARLHGRLRPFRRRQLEVGERMCHSLAEHEAIFEALRLGEPELAGRRLYDHVAIQGERFNDLVASYREIARR